ncbi:MAG: hypothetical protein IT377_16855 [Polyangiaceae bacterium]|nr:hypothetical protein [Polyangiaceae bacterium]
MKLAKFVVILPLFMFACSAETSDEPGEPSQTEDRAPIGKADLTGSCKGATQNFCGGKSGGNCWCDSKCATFGDCCSDKPAICDGATACVGGTVVSTDSFSDSTDGKECKSSVAHCVTKNYGACPQLSPLPPNFCKDGTVVKGADTFVASADGKECKLPSVHCVTKNYSACPQLSPLPPDFCKDGTVVKGPPKFIPSADGKECKMPNVHCVTKQAAACVPPPSCTGGKLVSETTFEDDGNGFECTTALSHCVTSDASACPQLSPLPPTFCPKGTIVQGAPKYITSADGKQCSMPSVHCVTNDASACPQLSPLSPDYCKDGEIVPGAPKFIASADGMECQMPSVHCVSGKCN